MLSRLVLTDFRNHAALALSPGPGLVVLTGENGAGKTNVLEAVSLLAPGRGLRRAGLSDMARVGGAGGFGVAATMNGEVELATGTLAASPERRVIRIQGAPAPAVAFAEWLTVLWLTPAMDRLFVEPAAERRRFLDRLTLALDPAHAGHSTRYEAAMRSRNRLLGETNNPDPEWLTALEMHMAEHGARVDAARRRTVDLLGAQLADAEETLLPRAEVAMDARDDGDAETLADRLRRSRGRDAAAGRTLSGPHRADLTVTHAAKRMPAAQASTGEQKALLLGIVLAHADLVASRVGRPPILLLDEVAAHLDPRRRDSLLQLLAGSASQIWLTGADQQLFDAVQDRSTRFDLGR